MGKYYRNINLIKVKYMRINKNHLKFLLKVSILCSYSLKAVCPFDLLFTFSTCHSDLKCTL